MLSSNEWLKNLNILIVKYVLFSKPICIFLTNYVLICYIDDLGFTLSNEQFEETYADVDNSTKWTDSEHFEYVLINKCFYYIVVYFCNLSFTIFHRSVWAGDDENEPVNVPHNAETSVVEEKLHGYELLKQEANELKQQ